MAVSRLTRILLGTHQASQLTLAILGSLIGLLLVMTACSAFFDFKKLIEPTAGESINSQYLVLNKKVSVFNSLGLAGSSFREAELEEIRKQPSVIKAAAFIPNRFEAVAYLELSAGGMNGALRTDIFLESVADDFIDISPEDWQWEEGMESVPVIIPADFIHLYNFTYAPARGLPQISKKTAQLFNFKIQVRTPGGSIPYTGRIAGFSDRISSMLVPKSFMDFANTSYGMPSNRKDPVYRIIAEIDPIQFSSFQQFMVEKNYETNEELLKSARFAGLLQVILLVVAVLGIVMIGTAFSAMLLYLKLVVYRSRYELETLLMTGASHARIIRWYSAGILTILSVFFLADWGILLIIKQILASRLERYGFVWPAGIEPVVLVTGAAIVLLLFSMAWLSLRRQILSLALPSTALRAAQAASTTLR